MKRLITIFLTVALFLGNSLAQERRTTKTGTTVGQFLKIGVHARSLGMGEASVANVSDLGAIHWNPAGLARYNVQEVVFSQMPWFAGIDLFHFAGSMNFGNIGVLGLQITSLDYGETDVTTARQEMGTGERYSAQDLSLGLAYSRNLTTSFSIGAQVKLVYHQIWNMSASTMAFDIGALFLTPIKGVRFGMSITNFGGKMKMAGRNSRFFTDPEPLLEGNNDQIPATYELSYWAIPLTFRVGLAGDAINTSMLKLSWALDALHPSDNSEYIDAGTELQVANRFSLRGGYRTLFVQDQVGGLSMGGGLSHAFSPALQIRIDYAWVDYGWLGDTSMFSFTVTY